MRFLPSRPGILASTVLLFLASTTRADFTFTLSDGKGNTFSESTTGTSLSGSTKLDGYNFKFTATGTTAADGGAVSVDLTATNPTKAKSATAFTYSVTESLKFTTAPTTLSASLNTGTNTAGTKVTATGSYANLDSKKLQLTGANGSDSNSKKVPKGDTSGALGISGGFTVAKAASTLGFTANGKVTGGKLFVAPEPAGVLACALGLPCMAAVVFLARRRAVKAAVLV